MRFFVWIFLFLWCVIPTTFALTLQEVSRIMQPIDLQLQQLSHTRSRAWFLEKVQLIDSLLQKPDLKPNARQILTRMRVSFMQYAPMGFIGNTPPSNLPPPKIDIPPKEENPSLPPKVDTPENLPPSQSPTSPVTPTVPDTNSTVTNTIPTEALAFYQNFFRAHGQNIVPKPKTPESKKMEVPTGCILYFDAINEVAKKRDFPVQLILANWRKETTCRLRNPDNGWWPFQIRSQFYPPGAISLDEFLVSVEKFIDFSEHKWRAFATNPSHKRKFGQDFINLGYDRFTIKDIRLHAIMYNGVSSNTTLEGNTFANNNLNSSVTGNADGIVTMFLKILNRQIETGTWTIQKIEIKEKITDPNQYVLTFPQQTPFTTSSDMITLTGTIPKNQVARIVVDDYALQQFIPFSTQWKYNIATRFDNLKPGTNTYYVRFYAHDDTLLHERRITIIKE